MPHELLRSPLGYSASFVHVGHRRVGQLGPQPAILLAQGLAGVATHKLELEVSNSSFNASERSEYRLGMPKRSGRTASSRPRTRLAGIADLMPCMAKRIQSSRR